MKITLKKILIYLLFNMGMTLVLEALGHYDLVSYICGGIAYAFFDSLVTE